MKTVSPEEIQASIDYIHDLSQKETKRFASRMTKEQPYLQIYIAAISERGDFENDNDIDAFFNLASIIWHAMRDAAGGPLAKVMPDDIDACEDSIMAHFEDMGDNSETIMENNLRDLLANSNQRPLIEFVLDALYSPQNPYEVTQEGAFLVFLYARVIIDCLDQQPLKPRLV